MENADLAQAIKAAASLYFTPEMGEHIGGSKAAERFTGTTGGNAHQFVTARAGWIVFAVLLWGRHQLGWRGHKAIRWTLAGFCLLMLAYFGSKLVREFILHI